MNATAKIARREFKIANVQGNILRGYKFTMVRYLFLEVPDTAADRARARAFLGTAASGGSATVPAITGESDNKWDTKPDSCFNIGITYEGLKALGTPPEHLASFPTEFIEGMARRAMKLGDFGDSAPANWPAPFDQPKRVHIIAAIYANEADSLDAVEAQVTPHFSKLPGKRDGQSLNDDKVHFGYRDSISQPRFEHVADASQDGNSEPIDPLGTALLGHESRYEGVMFGVPTPEVLGLDGTFNAFRILEQDTEGFEAYLKAKAESLKNNAKAHMLLAPGDEGRIGPGLDWVGAMSEIIAAQMCGRWRNGRPYETSPDTPLPDPQKEGGPSLTNFDYTRTSRCPAGSHVRRCNPRGGPIVQRIANYTRRLVRRGMPYETPDKKERGLLGNFIGASIGAQFEAVMCDWMNLGLHDPTVTGTNDPLIGANAPETSWFDLMLPDGSAIRLDKLPRFVTTRGGAYAFLPSLPAIRWLSELRT